MKVLILIYILSIIANRVGAESYENFSDDNMFNFKYEGTIRRQSGDLLSPNDTTGMRSPNDTMRSQSRGSLSSRASDLSYQQGYNSRRVASPSQAPSHAGDSVFNQTNESASLLELPTPPSSSFKEPIMQRSYEEEQIQRRNDPGFGMI